MTIRKWETLSKSGDTREIWVVENGDHQGKRHLKFFDSLNEAQRFDELMRVVSNQGAAVKGTLEEAGSRWIHRCVSEGMQRSTIRSRHRHLNTYILPFFGEMDVATVSPENVKAFQAELHRRGCSTALITLVTESLCAIVAEAADHGRAEPYMAGAIRRACRLKRVSRRNRIRDGVEMPTPDELGRILQHATGRDQLLIQTAAYTGLTPQELLGLSWRDIDLENKFMWIRQRANWDRSLGPLMFPARHRRVPLVDSLVAGLREWARYCPKTVAELVFSRKDGKVGVVPEIDRLFQRIQVNAGIVKDQDASTTPTAGGGPQPSKKRVAKYPFRSLRFFFAAWCAKSPEEGGLGLSPFVVMRLLGLSSFAMLTHAFGHFFNETKPGELDAFERFVHRLTDQSQPHSPKDGPSSKRPPDASV